MKMTFIVSGKKRLDTFFKEFGFETRSEFSNEIKEGRVLVNDNAVKAGYNVEVGDVIYIAEKIDYNAPKDLKIPIIYEDDYIIVINKPPYIATHGAKSFKGDSVVNWLLYYGTNLSDINGEDRPGIVHRLDADTSGILVIAKTNKVHELLQADFKSRNITKEYLAIVNGVPKIREFEIDLPIARSNNPVKMGVVEGGREALSHVNLLCSNESYSLLKVRIKTGRTHQIRVHLSHNNLPIIGDKLYGLKSEKIAAPRQMLHAYYLRFNHPISKKEMSFTADLPEDFKTTLKKTNLYEEGMSSIEQFFPVK